MVTYEQRVAKMTKVGDETEQLRLAKIYVRKLRNDAKKGDTLAEKLRLQDIVKQAEAVVRQLRLNIFELEDMLRAKV
jgi:hypothetical protein